MSPNVENIHKFTRLTECTSITKKRLSWLNNLFMVIFQLIKMSSYAKKILQTCWVTQHQYRSLPKLIWKILANSPSTLTFWLLQKWLVLPEKSIHGNVSTHKDVSLMLRTNYRCVELLNVSVEVAKCGKYSQIHPVHSLFIYYKRWPILTEQSIHGNLSTH